MSSPVRKSAAATKGSPEYFKRFWASATEEEYAYPRAIPRTQWDLFEREKARLIEQLLSQSQVSAQLTLEYGCGSAGMSAYLANQGFQAVATDINPEALHVAHANWIEHKTPAGPSVFVLASANAFHLPFRDSAFDVAMSYGLLEHFDRAALTQSLREARRVLRPRGLLTGDIVHGNFSARTVATWLNFVASSIYHVLRGRIHSVPSLYTAYFDQFHENDLGPSDWIECLQASGFIEVEVLSVRPFPPLAITGQLEKMYVRFMERSLRFYRWFDESQSSISRRWGWTYVFRAVKPAPADDHDRP